MPSEFEIQLQEVSDKLSELLDMQAALAAEQQSNGVLDDAVRQLNLASENLGVKIGITLGEELDDDDVETIVIQSLDAYELVSTVAVPVRSN